MRYPDRLRVLQRAERRRDERAALLELARAIVALEEQRRLEQERVVRRIEALPGLVYARRNG